MAVDHPIGGRTPTPGAASRSPLDVALRVAAPPGGETVARREAARRAAGPARRDGGRAPRRRSPRGLLLALLGGWSLGHAGCIGVAAFEAEDTATHAPDTLDAVGPGDAEDAGDLVDPGDAPDADHDADDGATDTGEPDAADTEEPDAADAGPEVDAGPAVGGDGCDDPIVLDPGALPITWSGSTADGAGDRFATAASCGGDALLGAGAPDRVFTLVADLRGVYRLRLDAGFEAALSVRRGCHEEDQGCLAVTTAVGPRAELAVALEPGVPTAIVVDGVGPGDAGAFVLTVSAPCEPSCGNRVCGDDGCGLSCGDCAADLACRQPGVCEAPGLVPANTCQGPIRVGSLPWWVLYDTGYGSDDATLPALACGLAGVPLGGGAPDHVYHLLADVSGAHRVSVDADFDVLLYATAACGAPDACLAGDAGVGHAAIELPLEAGDSVWLHVDGAISGAAGRGPYVIHVAPPCAPSCAGRACGEDGCGGSCGACDPGLLCGPAGACVNPGAIPGNRCEAAFVLETAGLPTVFVGDTASLSDDLHAPAGACPGLAGAGGAASPDAAHQLTAPAAGTYVVRLEASFDGLLYALSDCAAPAASCLAGADAPGLAPEELVLDLEEGQVVFLIVDGFSNTAPIAGPYRLIVDGP